VRLLFSFSFKPTATHLIFLKWLEIYLPRLQIGIQQFLNTKAYQKYILAITLENLIAVGKNYGTLATDRATAVF